jgi:hypothetical protein
MNGHRWLQLTASSSSGYYNNGLDRDSPLHIPQTFRLPAEDKLANRFMFQPVVTDTSLNTSRQQPRKQTR